MADINSLIAGFPNQLQEGQLNVLRMQQAQQILRQKALENQQQQAGQNALRDIYSNRNSWDQSTGMPRANMLGGLVQADPSLGLEFIEHLSKVRDSNSRSALTDLRVNEYYTDFYNQDVMEPMIALAQSPELTKLSPEQRDQALATKKDELTKAAIQRHAVPPEIQSRWENVPPYNPSWPLMSPRFQKRQDEIKKSWVDKEDTGTSPPTAYKESPFYPGLYYLPNMKDQYTPTNIGKPVGKPEPYYTETWKDALGTHTAQFTRDAHGQEIVPGGSGERYVLHEGGVISEVSPQSAAGAQLGQAKLWRVPTADGKGTVPRLLFEPKRAGDPWLNAGDKSPYTGPPPTSQITPTDKDYPGHEHMDEVEQRYAARLRVLGGPTLAQGWGMKDQLPGMAEQEIRSSLKLPKEHKLTLDDADMAAAKDAATNKGMHAQAGALGRIAVQSAFVQAFEQTAERNINLVDQLATKGLAKSGAPILNRSIQWIRRNFAGDPDLASLDLAMETARDEYMRVVTQPGASGSAPLAEGARKIAASLVFNDTMTLGALRAAFGAARQDMKNRVTSIKNQYNATMDSLEKGGAFAQALPVRPEEGREPVPARKSFTVTKETEKYPENYIVEIRSGPYKGQYIKHGKQLVPYPENQ